MNSIPRTYIVFSIVLMLQIIASIIWQASQPHLTQFSRYLPYILNLLCGALIGLMDGKGYLRKTLILGMLMSIINSIIHWSAGQLGVPVDFGDASSATLFAIIGMPIFIALCMIGGTLGFFVFRVLIQCKRFMDFK